MSKHDQYSHSYGCLCFGVRTVRKGGMFLWDGSYYQDDALLQYVGERIEVHTDYPCEFSSGPIIIKEDMGIYARVICTIAAPMTLKELEIKFPKHPLIHDKNQETI